jgi:streptogramin lyase
LSSNNLNSLAFDQKGRMWVVAWGNIVVVRDEADYWRTYVPAEPDNNLMDIAIDRQGRAWVRSWNGLGIIDPASSVTAYTLRNSGLPASGTLGNAVDAITIDQDGRVWALHRGALKVLGDDGLWSTHATGAPGGWGAGEYLLAIDQQGRVWASNGPGSNTARVLGADGSWTTYPPPQLQPPGPCCVTAIVPDEQGRVWLGDGSRVFLLKADGNWTAYDNQNSGLGGNTVSALAVDRRGRVWIGGSQGVTVFDPESALSTQAHQLYAGLRGFAGLSLTVIVVAAIFLLRNVRIPSFVPTPEATSSGPLVEWGIWPLWILIGVTAGLAFSGTLALAIGVVTGGSVVGFMPWLARRWKTSRAGWHVWNGVLLLASLGGLAVMAAVLSSSTLQPYFATLLNMSVVLFVAAGTGAVMVAGITRWVCRRWLAGTGYVWVWLLGGLLILGVLAVGSPVVVGIALMFLP